MISLTTMRARIRSGTGQDEDDLPDDKADYFLNLSYWEILEKFHVRETESSTTFVTVAGQREYVLPPSFESLRISAYVDPNTDQHTKLDRISIKDYENIYSSASDEQGHPTKYFRANNSIILWKTPDAVYTMVLHYRMTLDDLEDDADIPQLPKSWQECVISGGIYRAFYDNTDYDKGDRAKKHHVQLLNSLVPVESKEEWDSSMAGVSVPGRTY